ncbi:phosphotransferase family protein [Streptomyces sp. NBC_00988]|uniref:phosphotransferase family protein n=1 Tax=Streptomyces sp. NBC_00988 TaxID=2903704 RepID=UPI00386B8822|nr:phosphotransferase family protein [Streptomyces sp. NBC_00988]
MTVDELDRERLAAWLAGQSLVDRPEALVVDPISGGNQNIVARLGDGTRRMVLRRPPRIVPDGRDAAMEREFRLLTALEGTDVPHATPLALCTDHDVLGATFYVMSEVDGWSPAASMFWPEPFAPEHGVAPRRRLALELVRGLATLSAVDWQARGLTGFGRPDGFHERQVDRWTAHWDRFRFRDIPGLTEAGAWLRENVPSRWTPGIMHGDYSFLNVMFRHGPEPALAAVVDWEMATVGDPVLDLAWLMRQWPARAEDVHSRYVDYTGMPLRDEMVDIYRELTGNPLDHYRYYQVLANFKLAIVLEGGYARYLNGEVDNPKVAHYNDSILDAGRVAAELVAGA